MTLRARIDAATLAILDAAAPILGTDRQAILRFLVRVGWLCITEAPASVRWDVLAQEPGRFDPPTPQPGRFGPGRDVLAHPENDANSVAAPARDETSHPRPHTHTLREKRSSSVPEQVIHTAGRVERALAAGHDQECCLNAWQENTARSAIRALAAGRQLGDKQAECLPEVLDIALRCATRKAKSSPSVNVPAAADQLAKAVADLRHHEQVMRERVEDGLPVTEEMVARLATLKAMAGETGEEAV